MVVFTCGHCGESVQKPKVEKHYMTKCRNRNANLSCMDCFKDFYGKDYESHTKCVTEEQRYSGKGFVAKEKKGELKQTAWVDLVQSVLQEQTSATKNVLRIIETVSKHTNTPRKKPKFINFVKNVCGHKTNANDIETAWNMISVKLTELSIANQNKNKSDNLNDSANSNDNATEVCNKSTNEEPIEEALQENDEKVEKKSRKQMKEEKKRKKYEEQLNSAAQLPDEVEDEKSTKNEKKTKNKTNEANGEAENVHDNNKKNKKRKRIDTVNEVNGATKEIQDENKEVVVETTTKPNKKKQKEESYVDVSISLHDQNVAATEELDLNKGRFDWHATILSVLQKKGNEIPFKRLQKKVLGEYTESTGCVADDRIADKFIKKLKSAPKVKVDKNRVYLED